MSQNRHVPTIVTKCYFDVQVNHKHYCTLKQRGCLCSFLSTCCTLQMYIWMLHSLKCMRIMFAAIFLHADQCYKVLNMILSNLKWSCLQQLVILVKNNWTYLKAVATIIHQHKVKLITNNSGDNNQRQNLGRGKLLTNFNKKFTKITKF